MDHNIKFHSQCGEDKWLYENMPELFKEKGIYIDVGAAHPEENSNTRFLDQLGWDGYCVEPDERWHPLYKDSGRTLIKCAAGSYSGLISLDQNNLPELTKVSGHKSSVMIPQFTMNEIIKHLGLSGIDLLSLDVEGKELEIFRGLMVTDIIPYCFRMPKIIIAEYNTLGVLNNELKDRLTSYGGYELIHTTDLNHIFKLTAWKI